MAEKFINPSLMLASGNATIRHLYSRTVTLVDTKNRAYADDVNWEVFSGTLIGIGVRLFVATVSHSLENVESPTRYRLIKSDGWPDERGTSAIIRTIGTDCDRPDVGLMELDREIFESLSTHVPIDLSRISVVSPEQRLASLMGTPSQTVKIHPLESGQWGVSGTLSGLTTAAIPVDEWPKLSLRTPLDANVDILVCYPEDSPDIRDQLGYQSKLPVPYGISGGGLWTHDQADTDIWVPDNCRLVAIQSSWLSDRGYVRLTRVSHWLDLVYRHYPDLHDDLEAVESYAPTENAT